MCSNREFIRRLVALLMALIIMLSLVGCAEKEPQPVTQENTTASTDSTQAASAQAEPEPTVEPLDPAVSIEPTDTSVPDIATEAPPPSEDGSAEVSSESAPSDTTAPSDDLIPAPSDTPAPSDDPTPSPTNTPAPSDDPAPVPLDTPMPSTEPTPAPTDTSAPSASPISTPTVEDPAEDYEDEPDALTPTQRNSINMLNYMSALTQRVNEERGNQLFLESAYNSYDNLYPNAVDTKTQAQITSLMDTINSYLMISVKRERLEYIYEQNRAQAMRQAIPNPMGLLSAVQSGSLIKAAASVLYMAVDSATSYHAAASQADLEFLKEGWELDDAESAELHNSIKNELNYMLNMVRDYDLPGDYALNRESIESFVLWSNKPDSQLVAKISWLESHESTYSAFGPYWLELAKDYYNSSEYQKCLDAINQYEAISTRIFRIDIDYAQALPMAIVSAKETASETDYIETASKYCQVILDNTKDADWTLRYFVAQIYLDLYSMTSESTYLDKAYKIAYDNVVILVPCSWVRKA